MKKILPILIAFVFVLTVLIYPPISAAQPVQQPPAGQQPGGQQPVQQQQGNQQPGQQAQQQGRTPPPEGLWVADPEVTFIGKNAARSGNLLDWTLRNYNWVCVKQASTNTLNQYQCDDSDNPLARFWLLIVSFIVVPLLFVVILATAIVIIITHGKSLTIMRFIPRFVAVIILIVFSYTLLSFFYQFTDVIQGFFLRSDSTKICPPNCISQKDLLYVGWKYEDFVGLRLLHDYYAESAFMSLLLTKLTALTYFVMVGILLMRKIILWFFIIVSPIFPLLLLYYPVRNTGKIWIGEFFRWLLYAPLFAMFLNGLVYMWRQQIPLLFVPPQGLGAIGDKSQIIYPTAVNILLGGPKQFVTPDNSVNLTETFALYVVALIMLWVVILLPWILLQIFLDYASNFSPGESAVMKTLVNLAGNKKGGTPPAGGGGGGGPMPGPAGAAIALPFSKKFQMPTGLTPKGAGAAKEMYKESTSATSATSSTASRDKSATSSFTQSTYTPMAQINAQTMSIANMSLPSLRDIARYDTAQYSRDTSQTKEVTMAKESLEKIANPSSITNTADREKFAEIREKLTTESQQGNILATSILNAASSVASQQSSSNISNSSSISTSQLTSVLQQVANSVANQSATTIANNIAGSIASQNATNFSRSSNSMSSSSSTSNANNASNSSSTSIASKASAASVVNKEKISKLQESLQKASKEGNDLAQTVLKVNDKTSAADVQKIQQKIALAREKGDPIAIQLTNAAKSVATAPTVNRVQTVSKEDYNAVRTMWKENYANLEIPEGMGGNRTEWIKDDISKIDKIVGLLSSQDQEKVQKGMDEVGGIMPFLLMGGFSQTEIIAYLKAKQDAAKETVTSLAAEEDTKVSVSTGAAHAEKTMAVSMDEQNTSAGVNRVVTSTTSSKDDEDESPLASLPASAPDTVTNNISNEILAEVNLKMPKMRDIVRYDMKHMTGDTSHVEEVRKMNSVLANIANPAALPDGPEKEKFLKLQQKLSEESQKGNSTASFVLTAAKSASVRGNKEQMKKTLQQLANPSLATVQADKDRLAKLHDDLNKAKESGNPLAASLLSVQESTPAEEIEKISAQLNEAGQKGEQLAKDVLTHVEEPAVPTESKGQSVAPEEFDEVRKLWTENYQTQPVPQEFGNDRNGWIKKDQISIEEIISLLTSEDPEKRKEGMKKVSGILPFLLLGGFSLTEIVAYLKAKLEGAKAAVAALEEEESKKVAVTSETKTEEKHQEAVIEEEKKN